VERKEIDLVGVQKQDAEIQTQDNVKGRDDYLLKDFSLE
jgi:hypothetical protein